MEVKQASKQEEGKMVWAGLTVGLFAGACSPSNYYSVDRDGGKILMDHFCHLATSKGLCQILSHRWLPSLL